MLVMFVLITIFFSDLEYSESQERKAPLKESTLPSSTPEKEQLDAMEFE
jgi:hypothetical protein